MDTRPRDPSGPARSLPGEPVPAVPATHRRLEAALAEAARLYRPRLIAAAERVLRDPGEAEDAVQDALLAGLRSLDRFRGDSRLSSWLYRITVNCALMRLRSRRRRPAVALEDLPLEPGELPDTEALSAEDRLEARQRLASASASLARLSDVQREALWMRGVEDLAIPDVARRLGRTANAAKMLVHRARERVRGDLEADERPPLGPGREAA